MFNYSFICVIDVVREHVTLYKSSKLCLLQMDAFRPVKNIDSSNRQMRRERITNLQ